MQGPLTEDFTRNSTRSSVKDLYRIMQDLLEGNFAVSPQDLVYARIDNENDQELENPGAHTSCEPAQSKCTWTCNKSHFMREFTGKCGGLRSGRRVCASPRSRNAHGVSGPSIPSPSRRIGAPWCPRGRRCGPALELWDPVNTEANHPRNGRPPNSTSLTYIYIYIYIYVHTHIYIYSIQLYIYICVCGLWQANKNSDTTEINLCCWGVYENV